MPKFFFLISVQIMDLYLIKLGFNSLQDLSRWLRLRNHSFFCFFFPEQDQKKQIRKEDELNCFHQPYPWLACFDLSRISLFLLLSMVAFYFRPFSGSDVESLIWVKNFQRRSFENVAKFYPGRLSGEKNFAWNAFISAAGWFSMYLFCIHGNRG